MANPNKDKKGILSINPNPPINKGHLRPFNTYREIESLRFHNQPWDEDDLQLLKGWFPSDDDLMSSNDPMNRPMFAPQETDPNAAMGTVLGMFDNIQQNLSSATSTAGIMNALRGDEKPVSARRSELASFVGKEDAKKTPASVLTMMQPLMYLLEQTQAQAQGQVPAQAPMQDNQAVQSPGSQLASSLIMGGQKPRFMNQGGPVTLPPPPSYEQFAALYGDANREVDQAYALNPYIAGLQLASSIANAPRGRLLQNILSPDTIQRVSDPLLQAAQAKAAADRESRLKAADATVQAHSDYASNVADLNTPGKSSDGTQTERSMQYEANQARRRAEAAAIAAGEPPASVKKIGQDAYDEKYSELNDELLKKAFFTEGQPSEFRQRIGGRAADHWDSWDEEAASNEQIARQANTMWALTQKEGFKTGLLARPRLFLNKFLEEAGLKGFTDRLFGDSFINDLIGGNIAAAEAIDALSSQLFVTLSEQIPGNLNTQEVELVRNASPNLTTTPEGIALMARIRSRIAAIRREQSEKVSAYIEANPDYTDSEIRAEINRIEAEYNNRTFLDPDDRLLLEQNQKDGTEGNRAVAGLQQTAATGEQQNANTKVYDMIQNGDTDEVILERARERARKTGRKLDEEAYKKGIEQQRAIFNVQSAIDNIPQNQ